jgi:hypothetical protein
MEAQINIVGVLVLTEERVILVERDSRQVMGLQSFMFKKFVNYPFVITFSVLLIFKPLLIDL